MRYVHVVAQKDIEIFLHACITTFSCLSAAGCHAPAAPENGSVSESTSARVGATSSYECDDGLELEGESVATCTSSLQWEPASVTCTPPGNTLCMQDSAL